jgi:hypothetical protein
MFSLTHSHQRFRSATSNLSPPSPHSRNSRRPAPRARRGDAGGDAELWAIQPSAPSLIPPHAAPPPPSSHHTQIIRQQTEAMAVDPSIAAQAEAAACRSEETAEAAVCRSEEAAEAAVCRSEEAAEAFFCSTSSPASTSLSPATPPASARQSLISPPTLPVRWLNLDSDELFLTPITHCRDRRGPVGVICITSEAKARPPKSRAVLAGGRRLPSPLPLVGGRI